MVSIKIYKISKYFLLYQVDVIYHIKNLKVYVSMYIIFFFNEAPIFFQILNENISIQCIRK